MTLPRRFGRYLLVDRLAMGGMAEIYEARLIGVAGFEKTLAIKQILPHWSERPAFITMLIDEAKIAVRLNHPNIVEVYELGRECGQYYIAMEFVDGIDLRELQRRCQVTQRRLPLQLVLTIAQEVAQALHYAHQLKDADGRALELIHRDISPQNILVSYEGRVKVTDFGIAKAIDSEHETVTGTFKGKFAYMSPEQALQKMIDQRSDLFSFGIVLYELLTGQRLFQAKSDVEVLDQVRAARFPESNARFAALRPSLQVLVRELLSREPNDRPAHAGEVLQRLQAISAELELTSHRSALAAFVQELFSDRLNRKRDQRRRQATQVENFLDQELTLSEVEERETTATVAPPSLPEGTQILVNDWRHLAARSGWRASRSLWGALGAVFLVGTMFLLWALWPTTGPAPESRAVAPRGPTPPEVDAAVMTDLHQRDPKRTPPTVDTSQAIAALDPVTDPPSETVTPPQRQPFPPRGRLSVQAIPWGYVYLDGSSKRLETPLRLLSLRAGRHTLKVMHQASGESVQRTIDISGGKSVTCIARFGEKKRIECR